ncbi:unnamed protein product [Rotaria sordida]|uniref:F-box domain-containing protein n=1 Tax=Rotaria sordida TaxID=392033 RepID=A0A814M9P9_9BILA|nr:unnamed protein product [Rotaria sordida]
MGCNYTKVRPVQELAVPMPAELVLSTINDQLPVEIIYKILDELDIETIFVSLYNVCKRFNSILSTYDKYHFNLKTISLNRFNLICSRIRPEQIIELTLSDDENSPGLIEQFLLRFSLNEFVRLRSLTLIQINNEEYMNLILIPMADHTSLLNLFSIKIINSDETYGEIFVELIMSILTKPSLRKVHFDLSYGRTTSNPLPWLEQCSIRHMIFKGSCSVNFIRNTFIHAPQLETFAASDFNFDEEIDLNNVPNNHEDDNDSDANEEFEVQAEENLNHEENQIPKNEKFTSIESTNYLNSLTLYDCSINMSKFEWMLQEIPTLKRFRLSTITGYNDESILDGHRWTTLVSNMDKFEFIFSVYLPDSSVWDTDVCITTFRTPFWTEDKQWFVSLEKYDDEVILYTLPYLNDFYVVKSLSSSFQYRSTAIENSTLQIQCMNNVRDLYIDTWNIIKPQVENAILPHFLHVTHLSLCGKWPKSKSFLTDMETIIDMSTIEELSREEIVPTIDFITLLNMMPNLKSIKTSTNLLDALNAAKFSHTNCLRSFIIAPNDYEDQHAVNIEPFCSMFPRIQHLIIPVDNVDSCQYVLDQLKQDLLSVIFRITGNDHSFDETDDESENEEENSTVNLFSEWIQELSERYHCYKKQRQIHIWLQ